MLQELSVKNFAIIEKLDISFGKGLNILTGETGAGKSIIVGALEMLLGSRASVDYIRTGEEKATINAIFDLKNKERAKKVLDELGIDYEEEQLLLSREITRSGTNRIRINGQITTLALFREISPFLIDIHGQYEHQILFSTEEHRIILDELAGLKIRNLAIAVKNTYQELESAKKRLKDLQSNERDRKSRLDLLTYQIDELMKIDLKLGEEEELVAEHLLLSNAEKLFMGSQSIFAELNGEGIEESLLQKIGSMMKELEILKRLDPKLEETHSSLKSVFYQLQELGEELRIYSDKIYFDEAKLKKIEDRLGEISRLKRKYGPTIIDVLDYYENISKEIKNLEASKEETGLLEERLTQLRCKYAEEAEKLSLLRQSVGQEFAAALKVQLKELAMPQIEFEVIFNRIPAEDGVLVAGEKVKAFSWGIDQIEFMISPNPGEDLKPLHKIASGGEISRIMLAIKSIIADTDQVGTMVFDEIDSGIGGNTALKVAQKLSLIGQKRQVICITHLPQIASAADEHFYIDKEVVDGYTKSMVRLLNEDERANEVARMLGGEVSQTSLYHAQELINRSNKLKERLE